jgi:thermitase
MRLPRLAAVAALAACCAAGAAPGAAAATRAYAPDHVIVKFRPGLASAERLALLDRAGALRTLGSVAGVGAQVVRVAGDPAGVAARLNRSPLVQYAEPDFVLRVDALPNDARFGELYALDNTGQTGGSPDADIDAPEGWSQAGMGGFPQSGGVRVGIVDTGIDQTHEDLRGKTVACAQSRGFLVFGGSIREGSCADDNDHGTHVAGTVGAIANNGVGIAGVSFDSPLVICKALGGPLGTGLTSDIANCIAWTKSKGARVISMSFGGGDSTTLRSAIQNAWANGNGALLVAAAGNDGNSSVSYPAGYAEVVSVGATDNRDRKASFSNANADVELSAPGVDILSTRRGGGYFTLSGTSMATPHASGVAAVIFRLNPGASAATARSKLDAAVDDLAPAGRDPSFGFGRVNLCKAAGGACAYTGGG